MFGKIGVDVKSGDGLSVFGPYRSTIYVDGIGAANLGKVFALAAVVCERCGYCGAGFCFDGR